MPIYAYRCERCGHAKDVIQKFSDTPLSICPECSADAFRKQLSAPSFQLKGSGWYVTDFRDSRKKAGSPAPAAESAADSSTDSAAAAGGTAEAKPAEATQPAKSAESPPAASPPPAKSPPES